MAENGRDIPEQPKITDFHPLHFSSFNLDENVDKEVRLRSLKERQNEERQKKLEEIKAQALAAQRFKEQKEQERRTRLDEMRLKDDVRRHQVEERKRAINDAERDRLESILRRNHEREARVGAKKRNERSNIVFAFGSSTPRMLDPTDMTVSYWGQRRATSTQNITSTSTGTSLTRRQSERDLDAGTKKRATSAGGLERAGESITSPTTPAGCISGYLGRRRTDLVPTIPSRDSSFTSSTSRKSLNHSPGRAYSMSRLDQLAKPRKPLLPALNESNMAPKSSVTRSMSHLAHVGKNLSPRKPLSKADSRSMHHLSDGTHAPIAPPRVNRAAQLRQQKLLMAQQSSSASEASSRPSSSLSQQSTNSIASSVNVRHRLSTTPRKPRPASIAVTGVSHDIRNNSFDKGDNKPPLPKTRKSMTKTTGEKGKVKSKLNSPAEENKEIAPKEVIEEKKEKIEKVESKADQKEEAVEKVEIVQKIVEIGQKNVENEVQVQQLVDVKEVTPPPQVAENKVADNEVPVPQENVVELEVEQEDIQVDGPKLQPQIEETSIAENILHETSQTKVLEIEPSITQTSAISTSTVTSSSLEIKEGDAALSEMTTSMSKPRITTEEEAKAALAERRRLAREEAERQAEMERQRIEAEAKAELERQQREEEQIRLLVEMQRQSEQERLQEAIKEVQKREEEERLRREDEQKMRKEKEEADKKAKEEAERQKAELQKKLENEEKEREERRRRVEMIMSRTRGKNNAHLVSQQNSQDKNENKAETKQVDENELNEENQLNGTKQENGTTEATKNGKDVGIVDNIIPDDSIKNANTLPLVPDMINTDSINSNNTWQATQQYDSLM